MKKKILLSLILCIFTSFSVFADSWVFDKANVLSLSEKSALSDRIQEIVDNHNREMGVYVATVPGYGSQGFYSVEDFSEAFYKNNQLGLGNSHSGLLIVLCMEEREYDICAYGDYSHTTFTDFGKQKLADAAIPYFRDNNWAGGFTAFANKADKMISMSEQGNPLDVGSVYFDLKVLLQALIISGIAGLIIGLIVTLILRGKMNNVKAAKSANHYVDQNNVAIASRIDRFTHNVVTRTPINQNNNSGGGARGGTSVNGGGFSHSSGKF